MRARNIKPSFFKNELIGSADPLFGIVFQGLWCLADRAGRLEDRPLRIHIEVNPYRHCDSTVQALNWLVANGFVLRYESGGGRYLEICNFVLHQQPHVKEAPSRIPAPTNQSLTISTEQAPDKPDASMEEAALIPPSPFPLPPSPILIADPGFPRANEPGPVEPTPVKPPEIQTPSPDPLGDHEVAEAAMRELRALWPPGGKLDWIVAEHGARNLVRKGKAVWADLMAGEARYRAWVQATNTTPMNPAKFFGGAIEPYWEHPWDLPAPRQSVGDKAAEMRRRIHEAADAVGGAL